MLLVVQKNLEVGEELAVDVSCIAALSATVNVQIKYNGPMRRVVFGVSSFSVSVLLLQFFCFFQLIWLLSYFLKSSWHIIVPTR